jgi:hypothetical protein
MAVRPAGARWAMPHDADGVVPRVDWWHALHPTLMGWEATGGLVPPRQARDGARATGPWA